MSVSRCCRPKALLRHLQQAVEDQFVHAAFFVGTDACKGRIISQARGRRCSSRWMASAQRSDSDLQAAQFAPASQDEHQVPDQKEVEREHREAYGRWPVQQVAHFERDVQSAG